jgi:histidyl-tRNA synthetase
MMKYLPPRGMRDFYPQDMSFRNELFRVWGETAVQFGFRQYDAPVVEMEELLTRKSGEEIVEQIYSFEDKSGRHLALRPEMTPSLARMIVARQKELRFPLKWFAIAQCFRYERMTTGRKREHYQWNLDVIGHDGVEAEIEVIAAAIAALEKLGIDHRTVNVYIGSRALLSDLLRLFRISPAHSELTFLALDKREKIGDDGVADLLDRQGISTVDIERIFSLLSLKSIEDVETRFRNGTPSRSEESPSSLAEIKELFSLGEVYGVDDYLSFDLSIVRGLDYYSGIVFEAFDRERKFRAIFGGGRYDNLLEFLGGSKMPSVGLGFGDVVVRELLEDEGVSVADEARFKYAVGYMTSSQRSLAIRVGSYLRRLQRSVDIALSPERARHFFSRVGGGDYSSAIYLGPDEEKRGSIQVKDLITGEKEEISVRELERTAMSSGDDNRVTAS